MVGYTPIPSARHRCHSKMNRNQEAAMRKCDSIYTILIYTHFFRNNLMLRNKSPTGLDILGLVVEYLSRVEKPHGEAGKELVIHHCKCTLHIQKAQLDCSEVTLRFSPNHPTVIFTQWLLRPAASCPGYLRVVVVRLHSPEVPWGCPPEIGRWSKQLWHSPQHIQLASVRAALPPSLLQFDSLHRFHLQRKCFTTPHQKVFFFLSYWY